ncbi:MAG: LysM peptidoglycan-binding domain-containing protein, partial [Burkholderiales bacterium]
ESGLDDLINNLTLTDNEPANATAAVHTAVVASHLKLIHYTVRAGDTLYSIAREYGVNIDEIREENKIPGNNLVVGQVLSIRANCAASKPLPINS